MVFIELYFKSFKFLVYIFIVYVVVMIDLWEIIMFKWGIFVIVFEFFIKCLSDSCCFFCIGWMFFGIIIVIECIWDW